MADVRDWRMRDRGEATAGPGQKWPTGAEAIPRDGAAVSGSLRWDGEQYAAQRWSVTEKGVRYGV